jgi:hypothetical protein
MLFKTHKVIFRYTFADLTEYLNIEKGSKLMKKTNTEQAYEAIKQYVQTHVNGDADDLYCACCNAYDRQKDGYDAAKGEIEDFAAEVARTCLFDEGRAADSRKCREVEHYDSRARNRDEKREKKRIKRLVMKAWWKLSPEERGIIGWELCGFELDLLQKIWGISKRGFYNFHVNPARQKFAEAFGKVAGNPKLYAKLRAEVLARRKGQKRNEED